jgi:hypothetical protein
MLKLLRSATPSNASMQRRNRGTKPQKGNTHEDCRHRRTLTKPVLHRVKSESQVDPGAIDSESVRAPTYRSASDHTHSRKLTSNWCHEFPWPAPFCCAGEHPAGHPVYAGVRANGLRSCDRITEGMPMTAPPIVVFLKAEIRQRVRGPSFCDFSCYRFFWVAVPVPDRAISRMVLAEPVVTFSAPGKVRPLTTEQTIDPKQVELLTAVSRAITACIVRPYPCFPRRQFSAPRSLQSGDSSRT